MNPAHDDADRYNAALQCKNSRSTKPRAELPYPPSSRLLRLARRCGVTRERSALQPEADQSSRDLTLPY